MPGTIWKAIAEKYMPYVDGIELVGLGEPTLSAIFQMACLDIVGAGKHLYFATNGMTLGRKWLHEVVGETPTVSVSIDAWDAESYKMIRGEPTWDAEKQWKKLLDGIRAFRAAKPKARMHSQYTGQVANIDGLPYFIKLAASLGIQDVTLRPVHGHAVAREDVSLRYERDRTERAIDAARTEAEKAGIMFIAERPAYSKLSVKSGKRVGGVVRYLDFVPLELATCPISEVTETGSTTTTTTTTPKIGPPGGGFAEGAAEPVVIRSNRKVRDVEPEVVKISQPVIVAANGECWSCFGRHVVGNVLDDDWLTLVRRPRYQEFLRNRATGQVLQDTWCRNCPRVM
jgi:MoaA/NifB/PqqE/SkfB family radical SAM enzyme